jgi:GTPase
MIATVALVGRPNVGKSTLFNVLTASRKALVANFPGLTRDRQYGSCVYEELSFFLIDTGGIGVEGTAIDRLVSAQAELAIEESGLVLFLVDAREGLTSGDEVIADRLRRSGKLIYLVINKTDGIDESVSLSEFAPLGFEHFCLISASHRRGIDSLCKQITRFFPAQDLLREQEAGITIAVIGKPNVGKSTLVNRILGEERVMVFDQPGTTRDSIFIPMERQGKHYTLIDTAGIRRRSRVDNLIEKFSIVKTLSAIEAANVIIFLINAREIISDQDLKLLGFILEEGKALVIAVNKWDGLNAYQKERVKQELDRRLPFLDYAAWHFISALHGSGVGDLFLSIDQAYASAMRELSTPEVNRVLLDAMENYQPPLVKDKRVKLRYAHVGGHNPPTIIIHGTRVNQLPGSYIKYLEKTFRKVFRLIGTPIRLIFRSGENPYVG